MSRCIDRRYPPNWSAAKDGLYWREWSAVKRANKHADRHDLTIEALGYEKSHVDLTNIEFTKVLAKFRAISRPDDLISQLDALEGRKRRLLCGIERTAQKLKVGEAYVLAIAENQTGRKSELAQLTEAELEKVRIALSLHLRRTLRKQNAEAA